MVAEFEQLRRRLKAAGYETGANIIGSVSQSLYHEGLIPTQLPKESAVFDASTLQKTEPRGLIQLDGTRVRELRKSIRESGKILTQSTLGERACLSHGYLSQIENNKLAVSEDAANRLADALRVSLDDIKRNPQGEIFTSPEVPGTDTEGV